LANGLRPVCRRVERRASSSRFGGNVSSIRSKNMASKWTWAVWRRRLCAVAIGGKRERTQPHRPGQTGSERSCAGGRAGRAAAAWWSLPPTSMITWRRSGFAGQSRDGATPTQAGRASASVPGRTLLTMPRPGEPSVVNIRWRTSRPSQDGCGDAPPPQGRASSPLAWWNMPHAWLARGRRLVVNWETTTESRYAFLCLDRRSHRLSLLVCRRALKVYSCGGGDLFVE